MGAIQFLTLDEVVELHAEQLALYGGLDGLLNPILLESAVASPTLTFGGEYLNPDAAAMAAAYLYGLARNHAFNDGNKRIAAVACDVFLTLNGLDLTLDADAFADLVLAAAAGRTDKDAVADVIRRHVRPLYDDPSSPA